LSPDFGKTALSTCFYDRGSAFSYHNSNKKNGLRHLFLNVFAIEVVGVFEVVKRCNGFKNK